MNKIITIIFLLIPFLGTSQVQLWQLQYDGTTTGSIPYTVAGEQVYHSLSSLLTDTIGINTLSHWTLSGSDLADDCRKR